MNPFVSVVVVNWNGRAHLERGLPPLLAQHYDPFEVVLVDNGSTDGSTDLVRRAFPRVRLIALARNAGLAAANNAGIAAGAGEFVVTLNNDTVPDPGWLAALVHAASEDPQAAAVSSKLLFSGRPELLDSAGVASDIAGHAWDLGAGTLDPGPEEQQPVEVFGMCDGAALFRRAALDEASAAQGAGLGPLDEDFFLYLDDVDLSWRLRWLGYRCLYAPGARVLHVRGASSSEASPVKTFLHGRNKLWVVFKNYPAVELSRWLPVILLYDSLAVARQTALRRDASALRGRLAAWRGWGRMRAKHQAILRAARVSFADIRARLAPLVSPWAVRRRYAEHRRAYESGGAGSS